MDIFIEYMVKRKKRLVDTIKTIFIVIVSYILIMAVMVFSSVSIIGSVFLLLIGGIIYGAYLLITSSNVEYEYILVNSEMDVDKILNARRRKKMTAVNLHKVILFSKKKNPEFKKYFSDKSVEKIYASRDKNDDETYFIVYMEKEETKMILFNPNEAIIDRIKALNPQKTFID